MRDFKDEGRVLRLVDSYEQIFIAYSGGMDSSVLLHSIANVANKNVKSKIIAVHVNHKISDDADIWVEHCRSFCDKLGVRIIVREFPGCLNFQGKSMEAVLRQRRYEIFSELLTIKNSVIVTAHHADDQVETLLLQLFRGGGIRGLMAMPEKTEFSKGYLVRPLLNLRREELLDYAQLHDLSWVEDNSNYDDRFNRNYLRNHLIPLVKKRWPGLVKTVTRTCRHLADTNKVLEGLAERNLARIKISSEIIDIEKLINLNFEDQKEVIRFWLRSLSFSMPSELKMRAIINTVIHSSYDANPILGWPGVEIRRFGWRLYAMKPLKFHDNSVVLSFLNGRAVLPDSFEVLNIDFDERKAIYNLSDFRVAFRKGGEQLSLEGRKGRRSLKKLMQEWFIPPWLRDRIPLIYCDNEIVAVVGYYCASWLKIKIEKVDENKL